MNPLARIRSTAVTIGAVKRLVFLCGIVVAILGSIILLDPVASGPHNCGTALTPKPGILPEISRRCAPRINRKRWVGGGVFAVGALAMTIPGPRCLLVDD
jgi:hypothetical protein